VISGAHVRWCNAADPDDYMAGAQPSVERLSPLDRARELVMMGMRSAEGFDLEAVLEGLPREIAIRWREIADDLLAEGHVVRDGARLVPTEAGMLMADGVAELFF
jgi:coproporphyrinogen III oxidase-like Fe-S oxidoreductase